VHPATPSSARGRPPGPPRKPLLGNTLEFGADVLGFLTRTAQTYGDIASLRLAGREALMLVHPEHIEQVLLAQHSRFAKHSFFWRHVSALFGSGLFTSEGETWLRQRRAIQPAFHRQRLAAYGAQMAALSERAAATWGSGEQRDLQRDMAGLTLQIVSRAMFDADLGEQQGEVQRATEQALREIAVRLRRPLVIPDWLPLPSNLRYRRAVRALDRVLFRLIAEREARSESGGTDLLSSLLERSRTPGAALTRQQIRDEAATMMLAGYESTALALTWAWALLALHPQAEQRLHAELERELGERTPGLADLPRLRWTEAVVREALRLFPPVYLLGREAIADCEIGGWPVAAGTTLFVVPWLVHRDPRWFREPEAFRPERWVDGSTQALPRFAYLPFGGGPRACIGDRFAMMEAVLILACYARRWRVRLDPEQLPVPFPGMVLRPASRVRVRVERRVPATSGAHTSPARLEC
jgi:cytochrome P450